MAARGLRVTIVSPGYPRWKGDFTHPMVHNLARLLTSSGHRVRVVTIHYPGTATAETVDGVEVLRARYAPVRWEILGSEGGLMDDLRGSWCCRLLVVPMLASLAWRVLRASAGADVLLVQWIPTAIVSLPALLLRGTPMVLHSRTYPDTPFWRRVYRTLLPLAQGVIYNSTDNRRLTEDLYRHPHTTVIGSGINLVQYCRPEDRDAAEEGVVHLISVSRLVEFKGVEFALRAVRHLKDRGRRVRFDIVGDGPLRTELTGLTVDLGLEDEVRFCGALPHNRVPEALWASDVFLITSIIDSKGRTEGFGAVILEALAARLPVIASAVGGMTDIITDRENGLLVPEKAPAAIADAVERLLDDPAATRTMIERGFEWVARTYSDEALRAQYDAFLGAVIHGRR